MLGVQAPMGVFDHPPSALLQAAGITYREVGPSRANFYLRETTEQATKWLTWATKLPLPIP